MPRSGWSVAQKPGRGARLDLNHPWTRGLIGFWACLEGGGSLVKDACGNVDLAATNYGANNPWGAGPSGLGIVSQSTNAGFQGTIPSRLQVPYPMSIAFGGRIVGSPVGGSKLLGILPVASNASPFFTVEFYLTSQTSLNVGWINGALTNTAGCGTIPAGADFAAVAVFTGSTQDVWLNASKTLTGTATAANPTGWTAASTACLAGFVSGSTACLPAYWGAWWNRALRPEEARLISSGPGAIWQIADPGPLRSWTSYQVAATVVYFGDLASGFDGSALGGPLIGESPVGTDAGLIGPFDAGSAPGLDGSIAWPMAPDAGVESDAWLANVAVADAAPESEAWFANVTNTEYGYDAGSADDSCSAAQFFAGEGGAAGESWVLIAGTGPTLERFEVDPYAARVILIVSQDPDAFEVDPYAARVITP